MKLSELRDAYVRLADHQATEPVSATLMGVIIKNREQAAQLTRVLALVEAAKKLELDCSLTEIDATLDAMKAAGDI